MAPPTRLLTILFILVIALLATGCNSRTPRNADGGIDGTVTRVGRDNMNIDVVGGSNILIDTWAVCGDATNQNISVGDVVQVFASRELISYDAWRILDENGENACPNVPLRARL